MNIDLDLTRYAARVAAALGEIERDLTTDYHVDGVPILCAGEETSFSLAANDVGGYDLRVKVDGE